MMMEIYILITLEVQKHEEKNMAKAACFSACDAVDGIILADDGIGGGVAAKRRRVFRQYARERLGHA